MSAYGLIISLAIYLALIFTEKNAKKCGYSVNTLWDFFIIVVISGIIGARLYHVISEWDYYSQTPWAFLKIWQGGLAFFGAVAAGSLALFVYAKNKRIRATPYLDLIALALPAAQTIGRLGNWINQELYGLPTNLPWKLYIKPENRMSGFEGVQFYHPLFAYEMLLNTVLFFGLNLVFKKNTKLVGTGILIWLYIAGYSLVRLCLEYLRIDSWKIYSVNIAQAIALILFSVAIIRLTKLRCKI